MSFQRKCPAGTTKIMTMVESGLGTDEIAEALHEMSEMKVLESLEGEKKEVVPDEIRVIAQALAFRSVLTDYDLDCVYDLLSDAYCGEVHGKECFRQGNPVSRSCIKDLFSDESFRWLIMECPNGHGMEADGAIIGVSCFSVDGISRRNGEIEGNLGAIRFIAVLSRYHGLCIGRRILHRVEEIMKKEGCVRCMACIPNCRFSMGSWIQSRGYSLVGSCEYPVALGHVLTRRDVKLLQYVKFFHDEDKSVALHQTKNAPTSQDLNAFSSQPSILNNTSSPSSSDRTERNHISNNGIKKQNTSLPPHWRTEQPVRHQHENGGNQYTTEITENKSFEHNNITDKSPCSEIKKNIQISLSVVTNDQINRKVVLMSEEVVEHYQQPDMD